MTLPTYDMAGLPNGTDAKTDPPGAAPLNEVYLAQARSLPRLLDRLLNATPPDSLERCELVARIENLLELFEPAVDFDEDEGQSDQTTPEAIAEANAGKTTRTSFEDF